MNDGDDELIHLFHNKCLRRILEIEWKNDITTRELENRHESFAQECKVAQMENDRLYTKAK